MATSFPVADRRAWRMSSALRTPARRDLPRRKEATRRLVRLPKREVQQRSPVSLSQDIDGSLQARLRESMASRFGWVLLAQGPRRQTADATRATARLSRACRLVRGRNAASI